MIGRIFLRLLVSLALVLATAWGSLALWYQLSMPTAGKYALVALWCVLALGCCSRSGVDARAWRWVATFCCSLFCRSGGTRSLLRTSGSGPTIWRN